MKALKISDSVIEIWTDGGCRGNDKKENIGGYGAYIKYNHHIKEVGGWAYNTTNNAMELIGAINGLGSITNRKISTILYLDSAYVLNGIKEWSKGWKVKGWKTKDGDPVKNKELWIELLAIVDTYSDLKLVKVKGHSDNFGNIQADRICNEQMDMINNFAK